MAKHLVMAFTDVPTLFLKHFLIIYWPTYPKQMEAENLIFINSSNSPNLEIPKEFQLLASNSANYISNSNNLPA
jgi:hypothetical protein